MSSPVLVLGDFNAHLGTLGGPRGSGAANAQGLKLKDFIDRQELCVLSLSSHATGPTYTYHSGPHFTTVDPILCNQAAAYLCSTVSTFEDHPLNTSDHLPLAVAVDSAVSQTVDQKKHDNSINWNKGISDGSVSEYSHRVSQMVLPLIGRAYDSQDDLDSEIMTVCQNIVSIASDSLPIVKPRKSSKRKRFNDPVLKELCKKSKAAWWKWAGNGRPKCGHLYDNFKQAKKCVSTCINSLQGAAERRHIQKIDILFKDQASNHFRIPKTGPQPVMKLRSVDGHVINDHDVLMQTWSNHFEGLAESRCDKNPDLRKLKISTDDLLSESYGNEDLVFDVPVTAEELEGVLKNFKKRKSAGPDGVTAEHIRYGGESLKVWILQVFNAIIISEDIPSCFKCATIVPIYKGKGKDPLDPNSYRGISLFPVLSKIFESVFLARLMPSFEESGIPHINQTAYQRGMSCHDATFTVQESIRKYLRSGDSVFQIFYDLEKAFDSVEFPVLLKHLYWAGIHGKAWRLIRSYYLSPTSRV